MNPNKLKQFTELYFKINKIKFSVDENGIYHVNFENVLANRLGKQRNFSFSRKIHDDYGVEYASLNNDMIKYILRDSAKNGQILKAKLDIPFDKEKISFDKNILIKSRHSIKSQGISFLYKISSSSPLESRPEFLRYVVLDYESGSIFPDEIMEEFHNFELTESKFKFDSSNANKVHTISYEYLLEQLNEKYSEHESTNSEVYEERKKELMERHEHFKKECKIEENKIIDKIDDYKYRISAARSYEAEEKYRETLNNQKEKLENLRKENEVRINGHFLRTKKRIDDEFSKYNFEVNFSLISALVFEYDNLRIKLISTISNEETEIEFNQITNSIQKYICPSCNKASFKPMLSYEGHFCCDNCANYSENLKSYLCPKDNVIQCTISGDYVIKEKKNQCECCNNYFDKKYLQKDIMKKQTCVMCLVDLYDGEKINKNDAIHLEDYGSYFKKTEVSKSEYSNKMFPNVDMEKTTGSDKLIGKKEMKIGKVSKLTFCPNEMKEDDISKLASNLKEIETDSLNNDIIKEFVKTKKLEYNDNKLWIIFRPKKMLFKKYYLFNKKTKKISEV